MNLSSLLFPIARRFIAGETADHAIAVAKGLNMKGISAVIDFLGEDIRSADDAKKAAQGYVHLAMAIRAHRANAHVSVKLSQMGLLISDELCFENMARIMAAAAKYETAVWIDMEGSALTQKTVDVFDKLRSFYPAIGLCVQAYLMRTGNDLDRLMRSPAPLWIRLCKGAYKESAKIAFPTKRAVDGNFRLLVQKLLERAPRGVYPAFATHDPFMIDYILAIAEQAKVPHDQFEFEMLYGIQNKLLERLARQGYQTRVYIPYGTHWLPYFLRRLRERRENALFLMKNLFKR